MRSFFSLMVLGVLVNYADAQFLRNRCCEPRNNWCVPVQPFCIPGYPTHLAGGMAVAVQDPVRIVPEGDEVESAYESTNTTGLKVKVIVTRDTGAQKRGMPEATVAARRTTPFPNFGGTARKTAKTSFATAPLEQYADLPSLLARLDTDSFMQSDMRANNIRRGVDSDRIAREKRNVQVQAFLYAASREDDNDFHLILGSGRSNQEFLNVEISGLPQGGARDRLEDVQKQFTRLHTDLGIRLPGGSYQFYNPPIPVTVIGSLFYDNDHAPGQVGPQRARPKTAWEIHPVSSIQRRDTP